MDVLALDPALFVFVCYSTVVALAAAVVVTDLQFLLFLHQNMYHQEKIFFYPLLQTIHSVSFDSLTPIHRKIVGSFFSGLLKGAQF